VTDTGVQKIHILYTKIHSMMWKLCLLHPKYKEYCGLRILCRYNQFWDIRVCNTDTASWPVTFSVKYFYHSCAGKVATHTVSAYSRKAMYQHSHKYSHCRTVMVISHFHMQWVCIVERPCINIAASDITYWTCTQTTLLVASKLLWFLTHLLSVLIYYVINYFRNLYDIT
jgi:hypothetical protein